jgi:hypothetical protein
LQECGGAADGTWSRVIELFGATVLRVGCAFAETSVFSVRERTRALDHAADVAFDVVGEGADGDIGLFEDDVDAFIQGGNAGTLPFNTAETSLEVSTTAGKCGWREPLTNCGVPLGFVQDVASETRKIATNRGISFDNMCCDIPEEQLVEFTELSLSRAIIYSAKLLSFYFRRHGATELYDAVLTAVVF